MSGLLSSRLLQTIPQTSKAELTTLFQRSISVLQSDCSSNDKSGKENGTSEKTDDEILFVLYQTQMALQQFIIHYAWTCNRTACTSMKQHHHHHHQQQQQQQPDMHTTTTTSSTPSSTTSPPPPQQQQPTARTESPSSSVKSIPPTEDIPPVSTPEPQESSTPESTTTTTTTTPVASTTPDNDVSSVVASNLERLEQQKKAAMEKRRQEVIEQRRKAAAEQKKKEMEERKKFLEYERRKEQLKLKAAREAAEKKRALEERDEQKRVKEATASVASAGNISINSNNNSNNTVSGGSPLIPNESPSTAATPSSATTPSSYTRGSHARLTPQGQPEPRSRSASPFVHHPHATSLASSQRTAYGGVGISNGATKIPMSPISPDGLGVPNLPPQPSRPTTFTATPPPAPPPQRTSSFHGTAAAAPPPPPPSSLHTTSPVVSPSSLESSHPSTKATPEPMSQEAMTTLKRNVLLHWGLLPPTFQTLKPIDQLLCSFQTVFPPAFQMPTHTYFTQWQPISRESLLTGFFLDKDKVLKAVRRVRVFLHPDKLPRDLQVEQTFLCKLLWDVTHDAVEEYKKLSSANS